DHHARVTVTLQLPVSVNEVIMAFNGRTSATAMPIILALDAGHRGARPRRRGRGRRAPGRPARSRLGESARTAGRRAGGRRRGGHPRSQGRAAGRAPHGPGVRHHRAPPQRPPAHTGGWAAYARDSAVVPRTLPGARRRHGPSGALRGRDPRHLPHRRSPRPAPGHPGAGRTRLHDSHSAHRGKDTMTSAPEKLTQDEIIDSMGHYAYGWHDDDTAGASARR